MEASRPPAEASAAEGPSTLDLLEQLVAKHPEIYSRLLQAGVSAQNQPAGPSASAEPKNNNGSSSWSGPSKTATFQGSGANRIGARDHS